MFFFNSIAKGMVKKTVVVWKVDKILVINELPSVALVRLCALLKPFARNRSSNAIAVFIIIIVKDEDPRKKKLLNCFNN